MKKTKIICSIGPVSNNYDTFKKMAQMGMNTARVNFSHATLEERKIVEDLVKKVNREGFNIGLLYDTKGPDFRTGNLENETISLIEGKEIRLVKDDIIGNEKEISVNYPKALESIEVDDIVLLEDGLMRLIVTSTDNNGITCKVINGGILGERKGINVPGRALSMPFLSEIDKEDIAYACCHDGDYLALSFVSSKEDVLDVKKLIEENNGDMLIISKIESAKAIDNIDEIIEVSDGIMVARGDLGVEMPLSTLPLLQKQIVKKCREKGKFCVVATEMLASMYKSSRPTRAEVTDIANAVLDGTDAVMLSGETTAGKYPVDAVKYMAEIALSAEGQIDFKHQVKPKEIKNISDSIAASVVASATNLKVKAIVATTISGFTAKKISSLRPDADILATCTSEKTAHKLALNFGVIPVVVPSLSTTDEIVDNAILEAKNILNLDDGDLITIAGAFPRTAETNFMKIEKISH